MPGDMADNIHEDFTFAFMGVDDDPTEEARAIADSGFVWMTSDGRCLQMEEITDKHLDNILYFLINRADRSSSPGEINRYKLQITMFEGEIAKRMLENKP